MKYINRYKLLETEDKSKVTVYSDGTKRWHLKDKLHRDDGPAIEYQDGTNEWWLNGIQVREIDVIFDDLGLEGI